MWRRSADGWPVSALPAHRFCEDRFPRGEVVPVGPLERGGRVTQHRASNVASPPLLAYGTIRRQGRWTCTRAEKERSCYVQGDGGPLCDESARDRCGYAFECTAGALRTSGASWRATADPESRTSQAIRRSSPRSTALLTRGPHPSVPVRCARPGRAQPAPTGQARRQSPDILRDSQLDCDWKSGEHRGGEGCLQRSQVRASWPGSSLESGMLSRASRHALHAGRSLLGLPAGLAQARFLNIHEYQVTCISHLRRLHRMPRMRPRAPRRGS